MGTAHQPNHHLNLIEKSQRREQTGDYGRLLSLKMDVFMLLSVIFLQAATVLINRLAVCSMKMFKNCENCPSVSPKPHMTSKDIQFIVKWEKRN